MILIRTLRGRHPNPKYIPTPFLKRLWRSWKVPTYRTQYQAAGSADDNDGASSTTRRASSQNTSANNMEDTSTTTTANANRNSTVSGVDRNTSVRSVMTLPAYRQKPIDSEQVLGREGERDGIDVVVELPTQEADEELREEEMEALYQIRLARRRQIAEREERRRQRREARDRNDIVALQDIRERTRAASTTGQEEVDGLRANHEQIKQSRQRAVSSVSYADLGIARHDGTRIRANSTESERVGLLSDAASIALSTQDTLQHRRAPSASSVLSIDTFRSNEPGSPALGTTRSRASSTGEEARRGSMQAGSSPELIDAAEADLGDVDMPPHSPPGYDDVSLDGVTPVHSRSGANTPYNEPPPDYPGPTEARNNRLSAHMADLAAETASEDDRTARRSSRGVGGTPQLPSLRLSRLPQIVIEPSSAVPRDEER